MCCMQLKLNAFKLRGKGGVELALVESLESLPKGDRVWEIPGM